MLKKISKIITLKFVLIFVTAFLLGVMFNSMTGSYGINFSVKKSFARSEAEALINKKVECKCMKTPLSGTVISQQLSEYDGKRMITVEWETPLMNKFKTSNQDKDFFEKCMTITK